jgi:arsenate reductase-like glutaredoxin family protein
VYESRLVEQAPVNRAATLALAHGARRLLAKAGQEVIRLDAVRAPITDVDVERYLVHDDGFLRVPVLILGDLLVRGYTEDLYREALAAARPS